MGWPQKIREAPCHHSRAEVSAFNCRVNHQGGWAIYKTCQECEAAECYPGPLPSCQSNHFSKEVSIAERVDRAVQRDEKIRTAMNEVRKKEQSACQFSHRFVRMPGNSFVRMEGAEGVVMAENCPSCGGEVLQFVDNRIGEEPFAPEEFCLNHDCQEKMPMTKPGRG